MPTTADPFIETAGVAVPTCLVAFSFACSCCRLNDTPDASGPCSLRRSGVLFRSLLQS